MIILQAQDLTKRFNGINIFSKVNLSIQEKSRIALVGRNGAGKSTLVKMIIGEQSIDGGQITTKKNLTIGYLAQDTGLDSDKGIYEEMSSVFAKLKEQETKIHELEAQISTLDPKSDRFHQISATYDTVRANFEQHNGYGYDAEIRGVLHGFGFDKDQYDKPINELSGGQKTQLALAKLLLEKPELLILDEPTNHLDVETITWLEGYIQNYSGSLLIISHDRYFLDRIVNEVYDLANGTLRHYAGNYTQYTQKKQQEISLRWKEYEKQQTEISKLQTFVDKNIVRASTTKQAQARRKQLERMNRIEKPTSDSKSVRFTFSPKSKSGNNVLKVTDAAVGYTKILSEPVNLDVKRNQAIAIVGPNGVGKSTLLKSILGIIPFLKGSAQFGTGVDTGYYDQEQASLHPSKTVLGEVWDDHPTTAEGDIRSVLGSFLFSGDDVAKMVHDLSGGEKARLLLTKLAMQHNNFLILDEPTNHLDIDSREVLEKALNGFDGTILFVSHDRYFINKVASSVVELSQRGTTLYLGDYDYYVDKKDEQLAIKEHEQEKQGTAQLAAQATTSTTDKKNYEVNKQNQKEVRKLNREVTDLESQLDELSKSKNNIESQMAQPEVFNDLDKASDLQKKLEMIDQKIKETESKWEQKSLQLEDIE
ncbi:ABC-F family ATP-binding cassette domain-containing protein [Lentilactobacillus hilgardii]|uniref:ABC-F family ATP-binding cassette domain-containing protein n=1 Tax=Lentilactobacillus hilgardii TaxID=1588 RepID=UPI0021C35BF1|nr:ABC-F family ATP-binding cassette domain-containing protein [Lentilactobacillus hilgardii]MCP9332308.1 ABC-F family ATP-binding cassette domain-containing protein [Lentilactobacillus hilgardii]MCP9348699.1 ABC-F family ATP-binding cassette domain-containing protein [Lentilactobacillus hilgardii]MCP9351722.1 ABC-F family ATP-binding cassette domain-containing protein [Lentilactobacillus hilgardii]